LGGYNGEGFDGTDMDIIVGDKKFLKNLGGNPLENINYEDQEY
jgi:hypothetical protein